MLNNDYLPKKVIIVGGGTAGWMAASLLAHNWQHTEICLVESQEIGIVGVGEGSTPHLKLFFDAIGVADEEWMPRCNATYKNGITFEGWSATKGFEAYFHPFAAQTDDAFTLPLFYKHIQARMRGYDVNAHPDNYFLASYLTQQQLGPLPDECFPFGVAYGYHFDSALLGQFLAEKAQCLGVKRVEGKVNQVLLNDDGSVQAVRLEGDRRLAGDLFIDCSGFNALLLQKTLQVAFKSYQSNLFNNAAVVLPSDIDQTFAAETRATALSNGWTWKIPLRNRYGNGYVYSNEYIDADHAETELRQHLGLLDSDIQARHLKMNVGRVEKHWHKNCLAIGLSQGFIEPLEATALGLTFNSITQFMRYFHEGRGSNQFEDAFNKDINARFDGVRDYIVCHYKVNQRTDTDYWRDNAANTHISDNLNHILHLWQHSQDFIGDMYKNNLAGSYHPKSWACLLAGYGVFPQLNANQAVDYSAYQQEVDSLSDFIRRCGLNFKKHSQLLSK